MTTYIYADLLFIINLLADYIILYLTSRFTCSRASIARLIIGACLGAVFACVAVCAQLSGVPLAFSVLVIPVIMCLCAFGKRRKRPFISLLFFFYISSVLLYGGMYAMQSFLSVIFGRLTTSSAFLFIVVLMLAAFFIYIVTSTLFSRGVRQQSNNVRVEICDGLKTYTLDFLCDSGNLAKDPFSGKPVTIVRRCAVDSELVNALTSAFEEDEANEKYKHIKPRVIPLKTVSGATLLYAFVPESMYVYIGKQKRKLDSIVAIDNNDNAFFGKDGIIPGELIEML